MRTPLFDSAPATRHPLRLALVILLYALAWAGAGRTTAGAAEVAGDGSFPLQWPGRHLTWYYNPAGQPPLLASADVLSILREVAARWEDCGVRLDYGGLTERPVDVVDGVNVVGWKADGQRFSAWTHWVARLDGVAKEADVTLYANIFENYAQRGLDVRLELRRTFAHELGHVLGLSHSPLAEDAMSEGQRARVEWPVPSPNDLQRCRRGLQPRGIDPSAMRP